MELVCEFNSNAGEDVEENCHIYQDMCEELGKLMVEINDGNSWIARVENFGWRKTNGHKLFKATRPDTLLREILPETDNTFKIFKRRQKYKKCKDSIQEIVIQNWHHDSSTGEEKYYIAKAFNYEN